MTLVTRDCREISGPSVRPERSALPALPDLRVARDTAGYLESLEQSEQQGLQDRLEHPVQMEPLVMLGVQDRSGIPVPLEI